MCENSSGTCKAHSRCFDAINMVLIDSGIFVDLLVYKQSGAELSVCILYALVEPKCRTNTLVEREIGPFVAMQTVGEAKVHSKLLRCDARAVVKVFILQQLCPSARLHVSILSL